MNQDRQNSEESGIEEALRRSQQQLRLAMRAAGFYLWEIDAETGAVTFSDNVNEIAGFLSDQVSLDAMTRINQLIAPQDQERQRAAYLAALRGDAEFHETTRVINPSSGEMIWLQSHGLPILGANGKPQRLVGVGMNVTGQKRAEELLRESKERQEYLLKLSDALRPLADPVAIQEEATRILGEYLGADRSFYALMDWDRGIGVIERDYVREGMPSVVGVHLLASFAGVERAYRAGHVLVVDDVEDATLSPASDLPSYQAFSIRSVVSAPLVKDGVTVASMSVLKCVPHHWSQQEVLLVQETSERTWAAVERARAEHTLRAREEQYRALFDTIDEGFCTIEVLFDEQNRPVDYRFIEVNPAFARQTGLEDTVGKTVLELLPNHETYWFEVYGNVARSGKSIRFESPANALQRWYDVYAFRLDPPDRNYVGVLFNDITRRKQVEEALRKANEELEQRVAERTEQVRQLVTQLTMSEQEERRRISAFLHDDLQQRLFSLGFQLLTLRDMLTQDGEGEGEALSQITLIENDLRDAISVTRNLSIDLSPPVLHDEGLVEALRWLLSQMQHQQGLTVFLQPVENIPAIDEDLRVLLFQMIRELLFNVVKHAGVSVATVALSTVTLSAENEQLYIQVSDRGKGFDPHVQRQTVSQGLPRIQQRLHLIGGSIQIESAPGQGTAISLYIPL